jgi:DNA-binding transcriptional regulator LsrR (DeoR family)
VLSHREQEVLRLRFQDDLTQTEIAQRIGVSQMQVSRLIKQSLARVRVDIERAPDRTPAVAASRTPESRFWRSATGWRSQYVSASESLGP